MSVLITRPREDAGRLVAALTAHRVVCRVEPLLTIVPRAIALDLTGVRGVLLTSANGARVLAGLTPRRDLPAFCVGPHTAEVARAAGFASVHMALGDVTALAALVCQQLRPDPAPLLHVAARAVAGDLAGLLSAAGFVVQRVIAYDAIPATALTAPTVAELTAGLIEAAFFYSPRTLETFTTLAERADLREACGSITAYCLSEAVAERGAGWFKDYLWPPRPSEEILVELFLKGHSLNS